MKTLFLLTQTRVYMSRFRLLNNVRQSAPGSYTTLTRDQSEKPAQSTTVEADSLV